MGTTITVHALFSKAILKDIEILEVIGSIEKRVKIVKTKLNGVFNDK